MASSKETIADSMAAQIAALRKLSVADLQKLYREYYGRESRSRNRDWLFKRVAFRMQELRYGGLTEQAKRRAKILAQDERLRTRPLAGLGRATEPESTHPKDQRLPPVGTVLTKVHGGEVHAITVLADGFEYRGEVYPSLSRIAKKVTGTSWNGFLWLGLQKRKRPNTRGSS